MEKIRVLFVEDSPLDVELLIRYIKKAGFDIKYEITDSLTDLEQLIMTNHYDLVICDFNLSGFSGIDAIDKINETGKDIPVILVSGAIPDEKAIDAMLAGAKDYVLKDNLKRLIPAMKRELEALQQRREKKNTDQLLKAVFNGPVGVRVSDVDRTIIKVNAAYCEMMGYTESELIGANIDDLIPEDRCHTDRKDYLEFIDEYIKTGVDTQVTKRDLRKDGSYIDVLIKSNVFEEDGEIFVVSNLYDVSDATKYKTLFEESGRIAKLGGWERNVTSGNEVWTKQIYEIFGVSEDSLDPSKSSEERFYSPKSWKLLKKSMKEAEEKGKPFDIEVEITDEKGNVKWCRGTGNPIFENGKVVKLIGSFQDITDRKSREIQIKRNEEKYKFLFDRSPNPMLIFEVETDRVIDANFAALSKYGYTIDEFLKLKAIDLRPKKEVEKHFKTLDEERYDSDEIGTFRGRVHKKKNNEKFVVDVYARTSIINNKKANILVINDVTEKFVYEQELIRTNNLLKALISNSPIGLVSVDEKGIVEELWNPKAEEIFGWKREEAVGTRLPYVSDSKLGDFRKYLNKGIQEKKPFITEIERVRKNGDAVYLREFFIPIINDSGTVTKTMLLTEDITEKKKVEIALISSEQKYRDLVEASRDLVWRIDLEGNFDFINNASYSILGYSPESMTGNSFVPYISPEKVEETTEIHRNIIEGNIYESFPLEMITAEGEIKHLSATGYPVYDNKGVVIGCSGTASDITHIKAYQSQLEESLAEKEILIKEIHHRVKNNLAVISGLFVLQAMDVEDEETLMILQESQSRIKSIATIHEKLYQNHIFSSIEIKEYLDNLVSDIADTYERKGKDITIEVMGDEAFLNVNQAVPFGILSNELIVNAYKYAFVDQSKGKIKISIVVKGEDITFKVADNGQGLPIGFDIDKLSSLGMTLIRTLAEQLDSNFDWESKPGKGTVFSIKFVPAKIAKATWVQKKPDKIFPTRPVKINKK